MTNCQAAWCRVALLVEGSLVRAGRAGGSGWVCPAWLLCPSGAQGGNGGHPVLVNIESGLDSGLFIPF